MEYFNWGTGSEKPKLPVSANHGMRHCCGTGEKHSPGPGPIMSSQFRKRKKNIRNSAFFNNVLG